MRNPAVESITCYGKDLSFAEALQDPWFNQHLDYMSFVNECDSLFGASSVSVFEYQQDTVKKVSELLGLSTPHDNPTPRKNTSMNATTTEIFRVINRLQLSAKEKEKLIQHLHKLDSTLTPYANRQSKSLIDDDSRDKVNQMTAEGMLEVQKRYLN